MSANIRENIARVEDRMAAACARSGRRREEVKLIAVSKTISAERIREAYAAGLRDFGENRVQEAEAKRSSLADLAAAWHLIGHLQSNKAGRARELFGWVHSVDSVRVARKLDQVVPAGGGPLPVLIEVNLSGETTKFGVPESEVAALAEAIGCLPSLELRGLMTIPPFAEVADHLRPSFRRLRELSRRIDERKLPGVSMRELSMGMSHDFEVAIEEGATMVRVGTAIFGARANP